jgi:HlyD family secretion protein
MKTLRPVLALTLAAAAACRPAADDTLLVLNGRIEAPSVELAPKVMGRVAAIAVREGDRVKAGDVLVRLDLGDTALVVERDRRAVEAAEARVRDLEAGSRRAEIRAAEAEVADRRAALALAEAEAARQVLLRSKKAGTQRDLDRAQAELARARAALAASEQRLVLLEEGFRRQQTRQARAELERARAVLGQSEILVREAEIRAPADGVVLHRLAEPGQLVGPGQPAITLAFADRLYVRTFVPEPRLGHVRPGLAVDVRVDAFPDRTFRARVTEIAPDAEFTPKPVETREERVNLVYAAKVDLDAGWNVPLVVGQPAEVLVRLETAPGR